jgi:hypothetical protein
VYQTNFEGKHYELGTSGFLYRSNKLMYDHETKSLWSTLQGTPVVGPLVDQGIKLNRRYLVTTTWGQWKKKHPDTTVLSLNTGHQRDYGEGVAYKSYFATDKLMFSVPRTDKRLKNKSEVVAMRNEQEQLAVAADFLVKNPVFQDKIGGVAIVILTDKSGANRVYESADKSFVSWDGVNVATDEQGEKWTVTEDALTMKDTKLKRLPAHRAFWFGWFSQFPDTRLVK